MSKAVPVLEEMKTIFLGLGNPILADDGVGLKIARKIQEETSGLEVVETSGDGFVLLDHMIGYDRFILIDSIRTTRGKPGEL